MNMQQLAAMVESLQQQVAAIATRPTHPSQPATISYVRQTSHGLAVMDVVRHNGTAWVKSDSSAAATAVVGGLVVAAISPSLFVLATGGYVTGLSGLTPGAVYYLGGTAGTLSTTPGSFVTAVLHADSATTGLLFPGLPVVRSDGMPAPPNAATILYATTAGTTNVTASADGVLVAVLVAAGGGGGRGTTGESWWAASSSGGSTTKRLDEYFTGAGGGSGAICYGGIPVSSGETVTLVVGAGGAKATSGGSSAGNGGNTTLTVAARSLAANGGWGGQGYSRSGAALDAQGGQGGSTTAPGSYLAYASGSAPGQRGDNGRHVLTSATTTATGGAGGRGHAGTTWGAGGVGERLNSSTWADDQTNGQPGAGIVWLAPA